MVWAYSVFSGGRGTVNDPYLIDTSQNLRRLGADVNNDNDYREKYFKQTWSLNMWREPFTPIGGKYYTIPGENGNVLTGVREFNGYYDGNGYEISNVNIVGSVD